MRNTLVLTLSLSAAQLLGPVLPARAQSGSIEQEWRVLTEARGHGQFLEFKTGKGVAL